jgi:hypothetical protein
MRWRFPPLWYCCLRRRRGHAPAMRRYRLPGRTQKVGKGEHEVHLYEDLLDQYQHRLEDIDECVPDGNNPENLPRPDDESSAAGDDQKTTRGTQPPAVKWKNRRQCTPQSRARARFKGKPAGIVITCVGTNRQRIRRMPDRRLSSVLGSVQLREKRETHLGVASEFSTLTAGRRSGAKSLLVLYRWGLGSLMVKISVGVEVLALFVVRHHRHPA